MNKIIGITEFFKNPKNLDVFEIKRYCEDFVVTEIPNDGEIQTEFLFDFRKMKGCLLFLLDLNKKQFTNNIKLTDDDILKNKILNDIAVMDNEFSEDEIFDSDDLENKIQSDTKFIAREKKNDSNQVSSIVHIHKENNNLDSLNSVEEIQDLENIDNKENNRSTKKDSEILENTKETIEINNNLNEKRIISQYDKNTILVDKDKAKELENYQDEKKEITINENQVKDVINSQYNKNTIPVDKDQAKELENCQDEKKEITINENQVKDPINSQHDRKKIIIGEVQAKELENCQDKNSLVDENNTEYLIESFLRTQKWLEHQLNATNCILKTNKWHSKKCKLLTNEMCSTILLLLKITTKQTRTEIYDKIKYHPYLIGKTIDNNMEISYDYNKKLTYRCTLRKINLNTIDACNIIAKRLNIDSRNISFLGNKDKRAVTYQHITIQNCRFSDIYGLAWALNLENRLVKIYGIEACSRSARLGDLNGNKFLIKIRVREYLNSCDCKSEEINDKLLTEDSKEKNFLKNIDQEGSKNTNLGLSNDFVIQDTNNRNANEIIYEKQQVKENNEIELHENSNLNEKRFKNDKYSLGITKEIDFNDKEKKNSLLADPKECEKLIMKSDSKFKENNIIIGKKEVSIYSFNKNSYCPKKHTLDKKIEDKILDDLFLSIDKTNKGFSFINYFGQQRFGTSYNTHIIGEYLINKDYTSAINVIMEINEKDSETIKKAKGFYHNKDYNSAMDLFKNSNFLEKQICKGKLSNISDKKIFFALRKERIKLFYHAYQSYLFNKKVSEIVKKAKKDNKIEDVENIVLDLLNLGNKHMKGSKRAIIQKCRNLKVTKDDGFILISFDLCSSTYATMALREIIGNDVFFVRESFDAYNEDGTRYSLDYNHEK